MDEVLKLAPALEAYEARAKKMGLKVERSPAVGGEAWLAISLPGALSHSIGLHWRDGRVYPLLTIRADNSLRLLADARAVGDAFAYLMRCDWCLEDGVHPQCALDEAESERQAAIGAPVKEDGRSLEWDKSEGMAVVS
jgi:hypothetical protein